MLAFSSTFPIHRSFVSAENLMASVMQFNIYIHLSFLFFQEICAIILTQPQILEASTMSKVSSIQGAFWEATDQHFLMVFLDID